MATSGGDFAPGAAGSRTIDDLLICPVCLEPFKEPKTLSCLHTFCTVCLENCRRPYRRDISCPVCKKVTPLSPAGIHGLQNDFRIQQIREIINRQSSSPPPNASSGPRSPEPQTSDGEGNHVCDICKSRQRRTNASVHCSQCALFFCTKCLEKHDQNTLFSGHHIVNFEADSATDKLFCKTHKDYTVKFFCKPCGSMLCTICIMDHPSDHSPVPLDKSTIEKYQHDLHESLRVINSKLSEVKSRAKYLETLKQTHQKALFDTQGAIREKTSELIAQIKEQEKNLLQEVQQRMEARMREIGLDMLGEMNFHKMNIENLYSDLQSVIKGSPQECLLVYEELIGRMKAVSDTSLPSLQTSKATNIVKFIPSEEAQVGVILGQLQECSIDQETEEPSSPSAMPSSSYATLLSMASPTKAVPRRVTSILNVLSSNRKNEVKIGKVKAFSSAAASPPRAQSPNAINADELMSGITTSADDDSNQPQPSTSSMVTSTSVRPLSPGSPIAPASPSPDDQPSSSSGYLAKPKVVFKIDQIGGWPGKIMSPSAVAFLPDGTVVIAECENRLQIFDKKGNSVKIIAWGKIKPQGVAVTRDGKLAITDKKDKCVKIYATDGECKAVWGQGMFSLPTGITCTPSGKFIITDVDRHMVSVHSPDGAMLTQFGCWGSGDYQFNSPTYVTVNQEEQIIVSDSCNGCIKIFDKAGKFVKKFILNAGAGGAQGQVKRPQGLCVDLDGKIIVADRDNNRVSMYSPDGHFIKHVLERKDSIRYPCDVCVNNDGQAVVVESHSGFLSKEPHHAVKLFQIKHSSS